MNQIALTTDKNGRPAAYRVAWQQMRYIRMSIAEARAQLATGQAVQVPYQPYGSPVAVVASTGSVYVQ